MEDCLEICFDTKVELFVFAGYILQHAYSQNLKDFNELFQLMIFFNSKAVLSNHDLLEA
jgi:hypothetical protein